MELKIYNQSGELKLTVDTSSSSTLNQELMTENAVSASFTHPGYVPLDVNDYVMLLGVKFSIKKEYKPKQKNTQTYDYSVKFYAPEHDAQQVMYLNLTDGQYNPQFSLDGSPREHMQKWVDNMNRIHGSAVWSIGDVVVADNQTIEYNNVTCWDALTSISEAFGTEWWADGFVMNLSRCERGEQVELGCIQGLTSLTQSGNSNDVKFFTRLIPLGSTKNIDASRYGFSRLQLPDKAKYVDRNTHYGLYEHVEEAAFAEIFPHYTGSVTAVRSEEKTGEDKKPFTVYYFKDSGMTFDPCENEIGGLVKHVSFQTGDLGGRDFEANYNSTTKEWEIINTYPSDDVQIPGGNLIPAVGNKYIPWNFRMPESYERQAELDYKATVDDFLAKYSDDVSKYGGDTDYIYIDKNKVSLSLGQRVRLLSDKYFSASEGYRDTRLTKVVRKLDNLSIASVECTNQVGKGWKSQVDSSLAELQYVVAVQKESEIALDILKSWDGRELTDYRVMSALRTLIEIKNKAISKVTPDTAQEIITLLKGLISLGLIKAEAGLEVSGGTTTDTLIASGNIEGKNITASGIVTGDNVTAHETVSGKSVKATDGMSTADLDVSNVATLLRAVLKGRLSSETFISGLLGTGWNIGPEGDMEARSLFLRAFLEVPELRYNKVTVIGSEFWISDGGIISGVTPSGSNQYLVSLKLEEGDRNPFSADDILRGIYHHDTGFKTVMFRVVSVAQDDTMLVMAQVSGVPPCQFMNVARTGNFTNVGRQRSIYLSGKDGYIRFLDGVNSWEIAPFMVRMQLGNTTGFTHPSFGDMSGYSAFLEHIFMTGSIRVVSADGVTTKPVPVDKGAYVPGMRCYEYDRVSYQGSLYLCIAKETAAVPDVSSVDWLKEVSKGETGATGATGAAGAKGATGATGPTGSQGIAGTSQYFHVKYSAASNGNPMVDTPNTYIGTAVTSSSTAPTAYTSYKWAQFKGSQGATGEKGIAGTKGADGRTPYLHIKYSDNGTAFTGNSGENPGQWIGQYTDFTVADSTTFSAYTWSKIKGDIGATGATGAAGAKGATGATGPTGSQGIAGTSQYFHVKYSAASNGNPMVDTPNTYIGTAVTSSSTAPTAYTSYKWAQFKGSQGATGEKGIAGTKGADGRTPYLHIKYSDNGTAFTGNSGENPGQWIGQYTDFTVADSTTFSAYTWSKIKGDTGATGATGAAGAKGATGATGPTGSQGIAGTSQYFHVKYSAASNGNPMVDTPNTYIGTAVTSSATAPTAYTSYKWAQFKGSQGATGEKGIAGTKGADGRTPYLHIKYSDNGTVFTGNSGENPGQWIGQYTDFTVADSTTFSAYTWSKIKGDTGATGATGAAGAKGAIGQVGPVGPIGPKGTTGDKGVTGATGPTGAKGTTGDKGATGATGPTGAKGATGDKGATGPKGDKGDAIASSYMNGVMKYADPYFRTSANSTGLYNNSGGGAGIWERLAKPAGVPGPSGYYMRYRYVGGATSPGLGGFRFASTTYRNCEYIARIIAKFPAGYSLNYAANSQGDSPISQWLTPNVGTGSYTEYVYRLKCKDTGTFSSGMYFYFGGAATAFTAEVAYATVFDTVANDRTTYIDSNGVYTGTLVAKQITATNVVLGTANIGDGTISNAKISALDAGKISTGTLNAARIGALSITAEKIAANAITAVKIAAGVIDSTKINVASIQAAVVTAAKIAALNITTKNLTVTSGATIGGFKVSGNGLTNDGLNNDSYVIFRNDAKQTFAGIGGNVLPASSGLRAVARFENEDTTNQWGGGVNYACILSAKNASTNYALYLMNGFIGGLSVKVRKISSSTTLDHSDCWVSCYNSGTITVYLPSNPQVGKMLFIMRVNNATVNVNGNGKSIRFWKATQSTAAISNTGEIDIYVYDGQYWMNGWFKI